MVIISDASPIINLARIGQLALIPRLFKKIVMPEAVFREITQKGFGRPGSDEILKADWVEVRTCKNTSLVDILSEELDEGESQAIALALEINANLILIDEDLGRTIALRYNLRPIGILGILLRAKKEGLIAEVRPQMDLLITQARFFIHRKLYNEVLAIAGE